ncbi:DUF2637 domain-containing protein [Streptomyces sp. URMC 124]|uniref:DUF2637 domain-containing protein n=1 Tax=Streptomyces sp. URMC 124 TaxID=3423405 RepID=UPI003F19722C
MKPKARRNAMLVVSCAAIATTGWSLYAVTSHYGTPGLIAFVSVAAFDGIAYLALHLASEASAEGRSAFGARLTAVIMAAVSVALNVKHADLIDGGTIASLAFSAPSVGLLAVSELSWAGPRATQRAQRGERPFRPAALGGWSWILAPYRAATSVQAQARQHIEHSHEDASPAAPPSRHDATQKLRQHFAGMDPVELIQFASSALPGATPAEIAAQLKAYDISISAMEVALVLGHQPPVTTVERPDKVRTSPKAPPPGSGPVPLTSADRRTSPPDSVAEAARRLVSLGFTEKAQTVPLIMNTLGLENTRRQWDSVRRAFDRALDDAAKPPQGSAAEQLALDTEDEGVGQGGGGYA